MLVRRKALRLNNDLVTDAASEVEKLVTHIVEVGVNGVERDGAVRANDDVELALHGAR